MHRFLLKSNTFRFNLFRKSLNNFEPNLKASCFKSAFRKINLSNLKFLIMAFEFTDANFQEKATENKGVTVIDFWAEWCGPCKMIGPIVEDLAFEMADKALIGKMDVDSNQEVPLKFGVRAIPTIVILKDGELFDKQVGMTTKAALKAKIDAALAVAV
jgi:thioredoxin 1